MLLEYTLPALVAATVILSSTARNAIAARWRKLMDPYRPEHHDMRGPGPKWRAKHQTRKEICHDAGFLSLYTSCPPTGEMLPLKQRWLVSLEASPRGYISEPMHGQLFRLSHDCAQSE